MEGSKKEKDTGRYFLPASLYQCRVTKLHGMQKLEINYDSTLVFPTPELAEAYLPIFEEQLQEMQLIRKGKKYNQKIVQLSTFVPEIEQPQMEPRPIVR